MYLGKMAEVLESRTLVEKAIHPYTSFTGGCTPARPIKKNSRRIFSSGRAA